MLASDESALRRFSVISGRHFLMSWGWSEFILIKFSKEFDLWYGRNLLLDKFKVRSKKVAL